LSLRNIFKVTAIVIGLIALFSGCETSFAENTMPPKALSGILDLRNWDFEKDGTIKLDGEWDFYWNKLLNFSEFESGSPVKTGSIIVPGSWNKYETAEISSGKGFATYKLVILVNEAEQTLALKLPRIFTAYSIWADGKPLTTGGKVATSKSDAIPQYYPKVVTYMPQNDRIELIVQVSNFSHRSGGILESIKLGTEMQIITSRENRLALELFLFGALFVMGIYHVFLFIFRKKNVSPLYFGIFCILIAIRTLFVGEIYIIQLFPDFNWEIQHKIQTMTYYIGVPVFTTFVKSIFPNEFPIKALRFSQLAGCLFSLLVLVTPARIFTVFNPLYQVITVLSVIFIIYTFILACIRKRQGALLFSLSGVFFVLTSINDLLFLSVPFNDYNIPFLRHIIVTGNLSSFGLIVLVISQSVVLAINLSKAFSQVEVMTDELMIANNQKSELLLTLEDKVKERTNELESSNKELEKAYKSLSQLEKARRNLFANISHDLKTPMTLIQGYTEAILDDMITEDEQKRKYLKLIHSKIVNLSNLTNDVFELSQLESRDIRLEPEPVNMKKIKEKLDNKYRHDIESAGLNFLIEILNQDEYISLDINRIERVFSNLIYNAIKHTSRGKITVSGSLTDEYAQFCVSDTGSGISPDDLPHIFDRFYTGSKSRNSVKEGRGLGLAIAKEIVEYHGGTICAKSSINEGTSFIFTIKRNLP
jgi:signal transduction histidine kinase